MNVLQSLSATRLNFIQDYNQTQQQYDVIIAISDDEQQWLSLPHGETIYQRKMYYAPHDKKGYFTQLPNARGTRIIVKQNLGDCELYLWLKDLSKLLSEANVLEAKHIALITNHADNVTVEACVRALLAHTQNMPNFKRDNKPCNAEIDIIGDYIESDFLEIIAKHKGNALARYLTILPTNYLTPAIYIEILANMAKTEGWGYTLYDKAQLQDMGAGAFSAVARASEVAGIVKLSYTPREFTNTIALVGKGICFDTGGVSLKQPQHMYGMNDDMMGSAVAVGSLLSLSILQVPFQVHCYLAITTNNIGANAFLPNEVITALNGKTIEIVDTDAEGRMVLSDALCLASQQKPDLLIDYATLTGAAVRALGTEYSAIFSNNYDWQHNLVKYGIKCAEKVWPFPMDKHYLEELKSDIADLKQCYVTGNADHILAAKFLQQFVGKEIRWLHMDLASCKHKGGLAPIPTEISGVGVWYTCELIEHFFA
ncbi:M17 family metallopeptidase [Fastidiosibacter lacustris]|uniref:M17 family metallopeptidase n=1 Tax=Fastidiosibacter lacustris TaxID=2056695 RepID=UPI000E351461|nr:leucyl aminopeptidase family protein [Fastidiosibacter lacustris]